MQKMAYHGFTFLEVLISLFILSFGLLGVAALQLNALKTMQQNYFYSIAQTQLTAMIERLRVNHSVAAQMRECDDWNKENQRLLPDAHGTCHCAQDDCRIELVWRREHPLEAHIIK